MKHAGGRGGQQTHKEYKSAGCHSELGTVC